MSALPMTLEDALRFSSVQISTDELAGFTLSTTGGSIIVPDMIISELDYLGDSTASSADYLYLNSIPLFDNAYRPVLLSHILDRFRYRRLAYDTPDRWMLAFRRWVNLNMPYFNKRYISAAVELGLDDQDSDDTTTDVGESRGTTGNLHTITNKERRVGSDFPQTMLSGGTDYASDANDYVADNTDNIEGTNTDNHDNTVVLKKTGRRTTMASIVQEQRQSFLNVDEEVCEAMEDLFLSLFDLDNEWDPPFGTGF